jgi:hypothetical protein
VCSFDYNNRHSIEANGADGDLQARQHGQGSPVGSSRSPFSQYPFCHGDCAAMGRSRMPMARTRWTNTLP